MDLPFRSLLIAMSIICAALSAVFLFFPTLIYVLFDVDVHASASFIARRVSMMFLGLSVLAFAARGLSDPDAQRAFSLGFGVMMAALAALGFVEFLRGAAGPGIWVAVLPELLLSAAFYRRYRSVR